MNHHAASHAPHLFPQLTLTRAKTLLSRVRDIVWQDIPGDILLQATAVSADWCPPAQVSELPLEPTRLGEARGRRFAYVWYRLDLPEPAEADCWLHWQHGGESTAFIEGTAWAGFDRQHHRHRLPAEASCIWMAVMHMNDRDAPQACRLQRRNDLAWRCQLDLEVLIDRATRTLENLRAPFGSGYEGSFSYRPPLDWLARADRVLLGWLERGASAWEQGGLQALAAVLAEALGALPADAVQMQLVATAQAHLDPIFLWPEHVGHFKTVHTMATAARLMEDYEDLHFLFSQPALYEWAAAIDPGLGERIDQRLREGRWECEGAAYVEFDSNLPCGEGLLRSLLIGQKITRERAGDPGRILWLPDTFGFNACLPQLMRLCGVDGFWTTKIHWNAITHFPYTSFRWRGNDGSEVMAHLAQHHMGYMTDGSPRQLNNIEMIHRQADVHGEAVAPVGFGDGGGGISAEQIERVHRCASLHGTPRTRFGRVADFFGRLQERSAQLPSYDGELYLEYHRGVLTSRRNIKRSYRALERALQSWEAVRVARGGGAIDQGAWKRCCLMQFHDILPGTGIGPAMADCVSEMEQLAERALSTATDELASDEAESCLFNPLPQPQRVLLADGRLLELPPLAGRALASAAAAPTPVQADAGSLDNGRVQLRLDEQGCIAALSVDGHVIRQQGALAAPWLCTEMPTAFPVWEIEHQSLGGGRLLDSPASLRLERHADGSASLHAERPCGGHSRIVTSYRLQPEEALLRVSVEVDWQEPEALLQLHFPTAYRGHMARFGCPFGSVLRTQLPGMPHEQAQWEVAGSRWAAVCDDGEADGLFLVTRDHYGFSCREGTLTCSLVRSPAPPDCDVGELGRVLLGAGDAYGGQEVEAMLTDLGRHRCELAIGRYSAHAPVAMHPAALADRLFTPCLPYQGAAVAEVLHGCDGDAADSGAGRGFDDAT